MVKFGGSGRSKQACVHRRCPNMAVQVAEEEDSLEQETVQNQSCGDSPVGGGKKARQEKKCKTKVEWLGEGQKKGKKRMFNGVLVNDCEVCVLEI